MSNKLALLFVLLASCHPNKAKRDPACPEGTHPDPERANAVLDLVAVEDAQLCFGALWPSRVITGGPFLLDERVSINETAAKLGHLSLHQKEAARFDTLPTNSDDCAGWVDGLLALEAKAYAEELRLRRALQVSAAPYAFEEAFWAAPAAARQEVILTYLRAHPEGGGGVDALGAGYLYRCEQAHTAR